MRRGRFQFPVCQSPPLLPPPLSAFARRSRDDNNGKWQPKAEGDGTQLVDGIGARKEEDRSMHGCCSVVTNFAPVLFMSSLHVLFKCSLSMLPLPVSHTRDIPVATHEQPRRGQTRHIGQRGIEITLAQKRSLTIVEELSSLFSVECSPCMEWGEWREGIKRRTDLEPTVHKIDLLLDRTSERVLTRDGCKRRTDSVVDFEKVLSEKSR